MQHSQHRRVWILLTRSAHLNLGTHERRTRSAIQGGGINRAPVGRAFDRAGARANVAAFKA